MDIQKAFVKPERKAILGMFRTMEFIIQKNRERFALCLTVGVVVRPVRWCNG